MIHPGKQPRSRHLHRISRLVAILVMLTLAVSSVRASSTPADNHPPVTVYAAAGTMAAVQQIAQRYEADGHGQVIVNFASSSTLARQIESGSPFDVYISANPKWIDHVLTHGRISRPSIQAIAADSLVLVAPVENAGQYERMTLTEILDSNPAGLIAVGDWAHVPCGMYAKQALTAMERWQSLKERLVPAATVRAAQQYAEINQCQLAIVYQAGALQSDRVKVVARFDPSTHKPIHFIAASAVDSTPGTRFMHYLSSPDAQAIFEKTGYTPLVQPTVLLPVHPSADDSATAAQASIQSDPWQAIILSLKVAAVCTCVLALPGILLGYLLAVKRFPGCSIVNAIIHLPIVIPPVVTGYLALIFLGRNSSIGQWFYETCGLSISFTWIGAVVVSSIMGLPLLVRSVKTAVEMIDPRFAQAANTLGISPARAFVTVTLPLAAPGILAGMILAFARSLGEFGATVTFAGNIPGKTQTLSLAIYNFTQIPGGEAAAMHLVLISVSLCFLAMLGSEMLSRKMKYLARTSP